MEFEIEITNLEVHLQGSKVLRGVDLRVLRGEMLVILGPSGCGKTTLLRTIAGFESPTDGRIRIGETIVSDQNVHVPPNLRKIGMVFQDLALWPHLSVDSHLQLVAHENQELISSILERLQLSDKVKCFPSQLSGGEQQRLAIARALVTKPEILLLDEPFTGLDWQLKDESITLIKKIQEDFNITIIYVTHDQFEASKTGERFAIMNDGRIIQVGTLVDLLDKPQDEFVATILNPLKTYNKL